MACKKRNSDVLLIAALAAGRSVEGAAKAGGVSTRTVTRRLADPEFRKLLADARARLLEQATAVLAGHATEAAKVLAALLGSENEKVRLQAARILLSQSLDMTEVTDIQTRIIALEQPSDKVVRTQEEVADETS